MDPSLIKKRFALFEKMRMQEEERQVEKLTLSGVLPDDSSILTGISSQGYANNLVDREGTGRKEGKTMLERAVAVAVATVANAVRYSNSFSKDGSRSIAVVIDKNEITRNKRTLEVMTTDWTIARTPTSNSTTRTTSTSATDQIKSMHCPLRMLHKQQTAAYIQAWKTYICTLVELEAGYQRREFKRTPKKRELCAEIELLDRYSEDYIFKTILGHFKTFEYSSADNGYIQTDQDEQIQALINMGRFRQLQHVNMIPALSRAFPELVLSVPLPLEDLTKLQRFTSSAVSSDMYSVGRVVYILLFYYAHCGRSVLPIEEVQEVVAAVDKFVSSCHARAEALRVARTKQLMAVNLHYENPKISEFSPQNPPKIAFSHYVVETRSRLDSTCEEDSYLHRASLIATRKKYEEKRATETSIRVNDICNSAAQILSQNGYVLPFDEIAPQKRGKGRGSDTNSLDGSIDCHDTSSKGTRSKVSDAKSGRGVVETSSEHKAARPTDEWTKADRRTTGEVISRSAVEFGSSAYARGGAELTGKLYDLYGGVIGSSSGTGESIGSSSRTGESIVGSFFDASINEDNRTESCLSQLVDTSLSVCSYEDSTDQLQLQKFWKIIDSHQSKYNFDVSSVLTSFNWEMFLDVICMTKEFLVVITKMMQDSEFFKKFPPSLLSVISPLTSGQKLDPKNTARSSPACSRLALWARRIISDLYSAQIVDRLDLSRSCARSRGGGLVLSDSPLKSTSETAGDSSSIQDVVNSEDAELLSVDNTVEMTGQVVKKSLATSGLAVTRYASRKIADSKDIERQTIIWADNSSGIEPQSTEVSVKETKAENDIEREEELIRGENSLENTTKNTSQQDPAAAGLGEPKLHRPKKPSSITSSKKNIIIKHMLDQDNINIFDVSSYDVNIIATEIHKNRVILEQQESILVEESKQELTEDTTPQTLTSLGLKSFFPSFLLSLVDQNLTRQKVSGALTHRPLSEASRINSGVDRGNNWILLAVETPYEDEPVDNTDTSVSQSRLLLAHALQGIATARDRLFVSHA